MVTPQDLLTLLYTPDLTEAGIAYACRSLAHTYNRMGGTPFDRLRRIVAGIAVELGFRRYLTSQGISFDTLGMTPFTDPDRYDLSLGGRACDLKSSLIYKKEEIRRMREEPGTLLRAAALVPADQLDSGHLGEKDLYLFAFATALVTRTRSDLERALSAGQPARLVHPFSEAWARPSVWSSLEKLVLKLESGSPLEVELGGQGRNREFITETIYLIPQTRAYPQREFFSLAYLQSSQIPGGRIGVYSSARRSTCILTPTGWGNIWVYGMEMTLAGYITCGEFRRRSQLLPAGSRVLQYARTLTDNYSLPIADLYPMGDLIARVKDWQARTGT